MCYFFFNQVENTNQESKFINLINQTRERTNRTQLRGKLEEKREIGVPLKGRRLHKEEKREIGVPPRYRAHIYIMQRSLLWKIIPR